MGTMPVPMSPCPQARLNIHNYWRICCLFSTKMGGFLNNTIDNASCTLSHSTCCMYLLNRKQQSKLHTALHIIDKKIHKPKGKRKGERKQKKYTHSTSFGIIMSLSEENAEIVLGWLSRFFVRGGHPFFTFLRPTKTINKLLTEQ